MGLVLCGTGRGSAGPQPYKIPLLQKGVSERLITRYSCVERDLMRRVVLEELRAF